MTTIAASADHSRRPRRRQTALPADDAPPRYELLTSEGLEALAAEELCDRAASGLDSRLADGLTLTRGAVGFRLAGDPRRLFGLRTAQAVYRLLAFAVPRPRALLGEQHLGELTAAIEAVRTLHPPAAFRSLHLSAAGSDSAVLQRLTAELARRCGLSVGATEGDLQLRLRRAPAGEAGWEALIRLTPRPLATRPWRVCNWEGALNAAVAAAMIRLTQPRPSDAFLNPACGSGTLLIERRAWGPAQRLLGCDTSAAALDCAQANVDASGFGEIALHGWDATALPLPDACVDVVCADLPFGQLVGSHAANMALYPRLLSEAARVARAGARAALLTHEIRLMRRLLGDDGDWEPIQELPVTLGGLHPRIYLLQRTRSAAARR
jgi:23S rRNA G2445 N2-methylase RlmL